MLDPSAFLPTSRSSWIVLLTVLIKELDRNWEVLGASCFTPDEKYVPFSEVRLLRTSWNAACPFPANPTGNHPCLDRSCLLEAACHRRISGVLY